MYSAEVSLINHIQVGGDTYSTMDPSVPLSATKIKSHSTGFAIASREANKAVIAIDEVHNSLLLFFFGAAIA